MRLHLLHVVLLAFCLMPSFKAYAFESASNFEGENSEYKVLVFLSQSCPCSGSHVEHVNELARKHRSIPIYGVITDIFNETTKASLAKYYTNENFQIPLVKDEEQLLVKKYRALKTPHSVILKRQADGHYETVYEGGVSDSKDFSQSKKRYLQDNLEALSQDEPIKYARGRGLGCYIRRL